MFYAFHVNRGCGSTMALLQAGWAPQEMSSGDVHMDMWVLELWGLSSEP